MTNSEDPKHSPESPEDDRFEPIAGIEEAATGTAEQPDIQIGTAPFLNHPSFSPH